MKPVLPVLTRGPLLQNDHLETVGLTSKFYRALLKTALVGVVAKSCQKLSTLQTRLFQLARTSLATRYTCRDFCCLISPICKPRVTIDSVINRQYLPPCLLFDENQNRNAVNI